MSETADLRTIVARAMADTRQRHLGGSAECTDFDMRLADAAMAALAAERPGLSEAERSLDSAIAHCRCLGWHWRIQSYQGDGTAHGLPDCKVWGPNGVGASVIGAATPGEGLWRAIELALSTEAEAAL